MLANLTWRTIWRGSGGGRRGEQVDDVLARVCASGGPLELHLANPLRCPSGRWFRLCQSLDGAAGELPGERLAEAVEVSGVRGQSTS